MADVSIPWEKITRGLPRGRRYADDRAPTLEEIRKLCEYQDRRIRSLVYTMVSSGMRVGISDHLHWGNIRPIEQDGKIVAARVLVYTGEDDSYITFITPSAYRELATLQNFKDNCKGKKIDQLTQEVITLVLSSGEYYPIFC